MADDFTPSRGPGKISMPPKAAGGTDAKTKNRKANGKDANLQYPPLEATQLPDAKAIINAAVAGGQGAMVKEMMEELEALSEEELDELYEALLSEQDEDDLGDIEVTDPLDGLQESLYEAFKVEGSDIDFSKMKTAFAGTDLSEDFKGKAGNLFEAVVVSTVNSRLNVICESLVDAAREAVAGREADLVESLDTYLWEVLGEWAQENAIAMESGLEADIAENFMQRFRNLLDESYISIPEDKIDVASALAVKNEELMQKLNQLYEQLEENDQMLESYAKRDIMLEMCGDLSDEQITKVWDLVEDVSIEDADQFRTLVEDVRTQFLSGGGAGSGRTLTEDVGIRGGRDLHEGGLPQHALNALSFFGDAKK